MAVSSARRPASPQADATHARKTAPRAKRQIGQLRFLGSTVSSSGCCKVRPLARVALRSCAGGHENPFQLAALVALPVQLVNDAVGNGAEQVVGTGGAGGNVGNKQTVGAADKMPGQFRALSKIPFSSGSTLKVNSMVTAAAPRLVAGAKYHTGSKTTSGS